MLYLIIGIIAVIVLIAALTALFGNRRGSGRCGYTPGLRERLLTPEYKRAGNRGEAAAAEAVASVLREGDRMFTNVSVKYDGMPTELDTVIVNKYGVFIIEVKNYVGYIVGSEDDYMWRKYKTTDAGNTYEETVKNPIKQVKRQVYILARYLESYGVKVWVRGYAILLRNNSPVQSDCILTSIADIDRAIHTVDRRFLSPKEIESTAELMGDLKSAYHVPF